jgi:uncharacterized protein (TIGR03067 family)
MLNWRLLMCCLCFLVIGCGRTKQGDQARMVGVWDVVHLEDNGRVMPKELRRGFDVSISENHVTLNVGTRQLKAVYVLRPELTPAGIDLTEAGGKGGRMTKGAYTFEGDRLKLCLADPGRERPMEFRSTANSGCILLILERVR